jgi:hypothetical protein
MIMIYLAYKMRLSSHARQNMKEFWHWYEDRKVLATLESDTGPESTRVSQDNWWEFLETRLVTDAPGKIGFGA